MDTIQNNNTKNRLERSRAIILDFGYNLIAHKSRVKKTLAIFKGRLRNNQSHFENAHDIEVSMMTSQIK